MFTVIKGGADSNASIDWRNKFSELRRMELTLRMRQQDGFGPRRGFALLLAVAAFSLVMGGLFALDNIGAKVTSWVFNGVPFVLGVLSYQMTCRFSSKPWTYTAKLDCQLAQYEPINRDAYRQLQARTKEAGSLETKFVQEWLEVEHYAVELAAGWRKPDAKGFLAKKV